MGRSNIMGRTTMVELVNMCLIYTDDKILVQEKVGTGHEGGLVFPGGHIENGETLRDSVIREMKEETGLTIRNPQPCGFKDWVEDGARYLVLLYKCGDFDGELKSSDEGKAFWLDRKDVPTANWIWNMKELLQIFDTNLYSELFLEYNDGGWTKKLLGKDTVIVEKNCR